MPKENKHSRGRREEKKDQKRKRENDDETTTKKSKKQKSEDPNQIPIAGTDNADIVMEDAGAEEGATERPFYGMLEDEEQEYFRHADELLELNDFPSDEERSLFLANVYREAEGKELKIACSQSCSRLMERLILLSTVDQKKKLFEKFSGNFAHLVQHRFASHCCETLFIQSAPIVTEELTADSKKTGELETNEEGVFVTVENLFLYTLNELEGQMTFLLTDRFASHTLRVLLVILSGRPLEKSSTKTLLQSKRKEKISITGLDTSPTEFTLNKRAVPSSFQFAVEKIISDTIATMDTSFIRILATHPTGNPSLQLLLELELTNPNTKKGNNADVKTIISALLPDDITAEGSESQTFINGILYDAIGSRLLETICTFAPGKLFKQIYKTVFKDRIAAIARNEISSYVAMRVLTRLSKEDLVDAVEAITPQILGLVERNRTVIIKTLLERCHVRNVGTTALTASVAAAYGEDLSSLVLKMACIDDISALIASTAVATQTIEEGEAEVEAPKPQPPQKASPSQLHGSLLAQTMLTIPGPPSELIQTALLTLPHASLLALALYTTTSHIIQTSLLPTPTNIPFRRKLINTLLFPSTPPSTEPILSLALSSTGSHILDSLLSSTASVVAPATSAPLFSITERIANVLTLHEAELRESWTGRIVWRNWGVDQFKRKRGEWVRKVKSTPIPVSTLTSSTTAATLPDGEKEAEPEHYPTNTTTNSDPKPKLDTKQKPAKKQETGKKEKRKSKKQQELDREQAERDKGKSAIQLAREKFARKKVEKEKKLGGGGGGKGKGIVTGANAGVVGGVEEDGMDVDA